MSSPPSAPRLGFAGTPDFAAGILAGLLAAGHRPEVVFTRPDKAKGRGRNLSASPVKTLANQHDIPLLQPPTLRKPEYQGQLASHDLDLLIVVAYGLILPQVVLDNPTWGCLNIHASLLPRWRGAAPIERAIMAGDSETGICLMQMDVGLDTGPVYSQAKVPITSTSTAQDLHQALSTLGLQELLKLLPRLPNVVPEPQADLGVTYADKLGPEDAQLNWQNSAVTIHRQVRALNGRMPVTAHKGDLRLQVLQAQPVQDPIGDSSDQQPAQPGQIVTRTKRSLEIATGAGNLRLLEVKLNRGKGKPMSIASLLNGYGEHFEVSTHFD